MCSVDHPASSNVHTSFDTHPNCQQPNLSRPSRRCCATFSHTSQPEPQCASGVVPWFHRRSAWSRPTSARNGHPFRRRWSSTMGRWIRFPRVATQRRRKTKSDAGRGSVVEPMVRNRVVLPGWEVRHQQRTYNAVMRTRWRTWEVPFCKLAHLEAPPITYCLSMSVSPRCRFIAMF